MLKIIKSKAVKIMALLVVVSVFFVQASAQPGTQEDPLVTRSYVEARLAALEEALILNMGQGQPVQPLPSLDRDAIIAEVLAFLSTMDGFAHVGETEPAAPAAPAQFEVVRAYAGQVLLGMDSTEIILRAGTATAVTGVNGLANITAGADILNGQAIPLNHLLIVPRGDGRGMFFETDAALMIRGAFIITG